MLVRFREIVFFVCFCSVFATVLGQSNIGLESSGFYGGEGFPVFMWLFLLPFVLAGLWLSKIPVAEYPDIQKTPVPLLLWGHAYSLFLVLLGVISVFANNLLPSSLELLMFLILLNEFLFVHALGFVGGFLQSIKSPALSTVVALLISLIYIPFFWAILRDWLAIGLAFLQLVSSVRTSTRVTERAMRHGMWFVPSVFLAFGISSLMNIHNIFGVWLVLYFGVKFLRNVEAFIAVRRQSVPFVSIA